MIDPRLKVAIKRALSWFDSVRDEESEDFEAYETLRLYAEPVNQLAPEYKIDDFAAKSRASG